MNSVLAIVLALGVQSTEIHVDPQKIDGRELCYNGGTPIEPLPPGAYFMSYDNELYVTVPGAAAASIVGACSEMDKRP